jgi:tetratricopeptide (TPR) repeat protein
VEAYYNRGAAKAEIGQYFKAIADYNIAIQLEPDAAAAYYLCGRGKADLGQTWAAKQDLRTALKLATREGMSNSKMRLNFFYVF